MAGEWLYQQGREWWRSEDQIRQDLEKKFKSVDSTWIRDDQEIYSAAQKVIDDYISEIKKSKNESYWPRALEAFSKLQKDLLKSFNTLKWINWTSSNENKIQINDLANKIDDAENMIIERLALNRTTKVNYDVNEKQKEIGKNYFSRDRKSNIMTFQKDVNKHRIDQVLPALGLKNNEVYRIDYTNCKDQNIKNKMISMIGWNECTIMYNSKTKTYNIRGMDGKVIDTQRAYIYEWVTLVSEKVKSFQSQIDLKKDKEKELNNLKQKSKIDTTKTFDQLLEDPHRWPILKELQKTGPKLYEKLQKESSRAIAILHKFLVATEQRLDGIVIDAKKNNRNLQSEPITKKSRTTWWWLMEAHLIARNGSAEQNIVLFNDEKELGEELYDMIDSSYEEEYKNFLTSRITQKMDGDYAKFTKKENLNLITQKSDTKKLTVAEQQEQKKVYTPDQKEVIIDWLSSLRSMLQSMKAEFGDTWGDDDREVEKLIRHLDNSLHSLWTMSADQTLTHFMFSTKILAPLEKSRQRFGSQKVVVKDWKRQRSEFFNAFKTADKNQIRQSIRSLWDDVTTFGNTHTSHLANDIIHDKDLKLNDNMDSYFQNISTKLELHEPDTSKNETDESKNSSQIKLIDALYKANDWIWLKKILQSNGLLPLDKNLSSAQLKQVEAKCTELREKLAEQKKAVDALPKSVDAAYLSDMKKSYHEKKLALESKTDKTDKDYIELQTYIALEQNPEFLQRSAQSALDAMRNQMKYANIDHLVKWTIGSVLIDLSDWLKSWKNADIYNDIKWYGWFNLSDENAKFVWELGKMIVEEIAFTLAVMALTATTGVWWVALVAGRVALSWARNLNKLRKWKRMLSLAKSIIKIKKVKSALKSWDDIADGVKLLNAGKKSTEVVKVVNKTTDMVKVVNKTTDIAKVIDTTKDIAKIADTFDDVAKVWKLGKLSKWVGTYLSKLNPLQRKTLFADIDKVLSRWLLHQVMAKTYRGKLDDSTSTWITDTLKSSGMYGILWVVGRRANSGLLGAAAAKAHPGIFSLTKLATEEWLMFGSDFAVDIVMDTDPMPTMEEIAQNIGIWLGAELLPYVGKIKHLRIGKSHSTINGVEYSNSFLLEEINDFKIKEKNISQWSVSSKIDVDNKINKNYKAEANNKTDEEFLSEMNDFLNIFNRPNQYSDWTDVRLNEMRSIVNNDKHRKAMSRKSPDIYTTENRQKLMEYFKQYDIITTKESQPSTHNSESKQTNSTSESSNKVENNNASAVESKQEAHIEKAPPRKNNVSTIDWYSTRSFDDKIKLWELNKDKNLSRAEYKAFYRLLTWRDVDMTMKRIIALSGETLEQAWNRQLKDMIDNNILSQNLSKSYVNIDNRVHLDQISNAMDNIPEIQLESIIYNIWEEVVVPRSDGSTSKWKISSFDSKTWEYKVVRKKNGRQCYKKINQAELDKVNVLPIDLDNWNSLERPDIAKARAEYESIKKDFNEAKASGIHNSYNLSQLEKTVNEKLAQLNKLTNNDWHLDQNGKVDVIDVNKWNQDWIINKNNIEVKKELSFSEYHKDFELFAKHKENFSSADYKNFLENQFSDIRSQSDLNQKLAYHLIGLAQMRRISSNAHVDYRWWPNDSKNYAKFIQDKIGSQLEDVVLKKYLNDIVDGKLLDYEDMKKIAQHVMNNKDVSNTIGKTFIDSFLWSGEWIVKWTRENPEIIMKNIDSWRQERVDYIRNITEMWNFNHEWQLDGSIWGRRVYNSTHVIEQGMFKNGKLQDWIIIHSDTWLRSRVSDGVVEALVSQWSNHLVGFKLSHQSTYVQYENHAIDLSLWWARNISIIKISDYPELLQKWINPNNGYCVVDWDLFRLSNGNEWFKAIREWERVSLWRWRSDRFDNWFTNQEISREHLTICRNGDEFIITDHSTNGTKLSQWEYRVNNTNSSIDINYTKYNEVRKNLDQNGRNIYDKLWINENNYQELLSKYPELRLDDPEVKIYLTWILEYYRGNDVDKNYLEGILWNRANIKNNSFSLRKKMIGEANNRNSRWYLNNGLLNDINIWFIHILKDSFMYTHFNNHYCTASIPTFIKSISTGDGMRFVDKNWDVFYIKTDADVNTSLKINKHSNKVEFWWIPDLWLKVSQYVQWLKANGNLDINHINTEFKNKYIPYVLKEVNGMLEIQVNDVLKFESVALHDNANINNWAFRNAQRWELENNPLFLKFSQSIITLDKMRTEWVDVWTVRKMFIDLKKLKDDQVFSYWKDNYNVLDNKTIDSIDFDAIIEKIENPLYYREINTIIYNNSNNPYNALLWILSLSNNKSVYN